MTTLIAGDDQPLDDEGRWVARVTYLVDGNKCLPVQVLISAAGLDLGSGVPLACLRRVNYTRDMTANAEKFLAAFSSQIGDGNAKQ